MQSRKDGKYAGFFNTLGGAMIGAATWAHMSYIPNKRYLDQIKGQRGYHHLARDVYSRMELHSAIIPIAGAAGYAMGRAFTFFARNESETKSSDQVIEQTKVVKK